MCVCVCADSAGFRVQRNAMSIEAEKERELQPTVSQMCATTRKRHVEVLRTPSRDASSSGSGCSSFDGDCEVSSVLRPKRKSTTSEEDFQLYSQPSWSSEDSTTRRSLSLDLGEAGRNSYSTSNKKPRLVKQQEGVLSGSLGILSEGELELVLTFCDARTLATLNCTSKYFTSTMITEEVAKRQVRGMPSYDGIQPSRSESWMSLLHYLTCSQNAREAEKRVGLGSYHTAFIQESIRPDDTGLYTCGRGFHGQLGNGKYENQGVPERIELLTSSTSSPPSASAPSVDCREPPLAIACGSSHNAAISRSGQLYTWGLASSGELGHGGWTPIELNIPKHLSCLTKVKITSVSCGSNHTVATSACGGIWTCGRGRNGQLGHGHLHDEGPMKKVEALAKYKVTKVAAGGTHTLALCSNGLVFSWGNDLQGQLGLQVDKHREDYSKSVARPQEIVTLRPKSSKDPHRVVSLSGGDRHSLAVTANGMLFVWGDGTHGGLGLGDNTRRCVPTRVRFLQMNSREEAGKVRCIHACAGGHHTAILMYNSKDCTTTLLTTGYNNYGQLGHNDRFSRNVFTPVKFFQKKKITIQSICLGNSSTAAITPDNKIYLWGRGELGQLGTNDYRSHWLPKLVNN